MKTSLLLLAILFISPCFSAPNPNEAFVISTTERLPHKENGKEGEPTNEAPTVPQIYEMHIRSNISNRFSYTMVTSKVRNFATKAQQASFSMLLPESAFISGFIMEVGDKNYTAYVKEKEEAKRVYEQAVASGSAAAHVAVNVRDSNRFTVSVNVQPEEKAVFYLSYEQFLVRRNDLYEQVINIHPGQPVKNLGVEVVINESRKIIKLKAPPLRSGNEIGVDKPELDPRADIEIINDTCAIVKFAPNLERQKELGHIFGTNVENGLIGQFVVQYDVERDPQGGEVLVQDGYFVHFFAPTNLEPLPKQVVFILDTSGSMRGQKLQQLKEAMHKILDQLNPHDYLNLVEFNTNAKVINLDHEEKSVWYPERKKAYHSYNNRDAESSTITNLESANFPRAYPVNPVNINKAKQAVTDLMIDGSTGMYGALQVGLRLVEIEKTHPQDDVKRQPIIVFLTDGQPTDLSTNEIVTKITEFNSELRRAAIFALALGEGADKKFLQNLAFRNSGYAKPIYVAADTALQLQDFYKQISSPLLTDVTFKYEPSVTSLTKTEFPIHFGGSEIVVAGYCGKKILSPIIDTVGVRGPIVLKPTINPAISSMERLWAYLTISQLLERKETANTNETVVLQQKALELALKYSFVTPVSSLVVVKPNETNTVDAEQVDSKSQGRGGNVRARIGVPKFKVFSSPERRRINPVSSISTESNQLVRKTGQSKSNLEVLLEALPWLNGILTDGVLKLPQGSYKLGVNETISDNAVCSKTPLNQEGRCTLLHDCPQVHSLLKNASNFIDHFCVLKTEFAGICCPNK